MSKPFAINLNPSKYRHPDQLAEDLRRNRGEFAIDMTMKFEKYFAHIEQCKARSLYKAQDFVKEYKQDLKSIRKSVRKRIR